MSTISEAGLEYKSALSELTFNSKPVISMLTMLADDYKDSGSEDIVRCIESRLHEVSSDKKLPLLYLMDSICKNIRGKYIELFTQNIVSNFCHVFEKADEKTRLSLYKLRQTWVEIFPSRKLYAVDVRIRDIDPAWPVTAPKPEDAKSKQSNTKESTLSKSSSVAKAQQQVYLNPKFFDEAKKVSSIDNSYKHTTSQKSEQEVINAQLIQKQKELYEIEKQKNELALWRRQALLDDKERSLKEKEEKLKKKEEQLLQEVSPKKAKKRARTAKSRSPSPGVHKNVTSQKWPRSSITRNSNKSRSRSPHTQWSKQQSQKVSNSNKLRSTRSPLHLKRNEIKMGPKIKHPLTTGPGASPPTVAPAPITTSVILASNDLRNVPGLASSNTIAPPINSLPPLISGPDLASSSIAPISTVSTSLPQVNNIAQRPNGPEFDILPWAQDRDYRKEFEAMMYEADEKLRSGMLSSQDHDDLVREMERAMAHNQISNGSSNMNSLNGPNGIDNYINDREQLYTLVDGKSRNLYYLDEKTAIVLMKGPLNAPFSELIKANPTDLVPKEIRFEGKPTKVFIDSDRGSNEFVLLDFNNQSQTFFHNEHEQRIRFGGPCKEIILNGKPYLAKFGGPPIQVWFNGDNITPHTLRLDGPPPRVKLSDELRCDLWNTYVQKVINSHKEITETSHPLAPSQPPVNVNELFSKLVAAGIIKNKEASHENVNNTSIFSTNQSHLKYSPPASPPARVKMDEEVQLPNEPALILSPDSLKVHRPSVVAAIYNGIQCTNCSLRFDDKDSDGQTTARSKYSKHLDWHFRQNRKDKTKPTASSASLKRSWFYSFELWLQFKEVSDDDDSNNKIFDESEKDSDLEDIPVSTVTASENEELNKCAMCNEAFEISWFEEEEEWKLMKAVIYKDNKIYHPLCLEDYLKQQEEEHESLAVHTSESAEPNDVEMEEIKLNHVQTKLELESINETESELKPQITPQLDPQFKLQCKSEPRPLPESTKSESQQPKPESETDIDMQSCTDLELKFENEKVSKIKSEPEQELDLQNQNFLDLKLKLDSESSSEDSSNSEINVDFDPKIEANFESNFEAKVESEKEFNQEFKDELKLEVIKEIKEIKDEVKDEIKEKVKHEEFENEKEEENLEKEIKEEIEEHPEKESETETKKKFEKEAEGQVENPIKEMPPVLRGREESALCAIM